MNYDNNSISEIATEPQSYMFLDKRTIIIGKKETGKTTTVKNIVSSLGDVFSEYIVVSPKPENYNNLETKTVYTSLDSKGIQEIWEKSSYNMIVTNICNNVKVLKSLCNKIDQYWSNIQKSNKNLSLHNCKQKIKENMSIMSELKLEPDEYIAVNKLDTNTKLCLIIDGGVDLVDNWEKYAQEENVAHNIVGLSDITGLTIIITCDDDNKLSSNVFRKMSNVIFTDSPSLVLCTSKIMRDFSQRKRRDAIELAKKVFVPGSYYKIMTAIGSSAFDVLAIDKIDKNVNKSIDSFDKEMREILESKNNTS